MFSSAATVLGVGDLDSSFNVAFGQFVSAPSSSYTTDFQIGSFTDAVGTDTTFSIVSVEIERATGALLNGGGDIGVNILDSVGGLIADLGTQTIGSTAGSYFFTPGSAVILNANTAYQIVFTASNFTGNGTTVADNADDFRFNYGGVVSSAAEFTGSEIEGAGSGDPAGSSFYQNGAATGDLQGVGFNMLVDASPVPEPSSSLLLGLTGLGFIIRRKR